jgi:S-layer protein (TIGR01564 family)
MKVRKAIKRIAALGVGATMLGATMMGAMAADLNEYPNMFIKDGQFQGILVIGKDAAATDTIGMTNVALGLQVAAKTCT